MSIAPSKNGKVQTFKYDENYALLCYYAVRLSRKSAKNYRYSLRNNPEERNFHLLRGGSLKSRISSMMIACDGRREKLTGIVKSNRVV